MSPTHQTQVAIWDAVETANVLDPVLKKGDPLTETHLSEIQRRREPATKRMQTLQRIAGRRLLTAVAADRARRFRVPALVRLLLKIPGLRALGPRLIALGGKRTRCHLHPYFQDEKGQEEVKN